MTNVQLLTGGADGPTSKQLQMLGHPGTWEQSWITTWKQSQITKWVSQYLRVPGVTTRVEAQNHNRGLCLAELSLRAAVRRWQGGPDPHLQLSFMWNESGLVNGSACLRRTRRNRRAEPPCTHSSSFIRHVKLINSSARRLNFQVSAALFPCLWPLSCSSVCLLSI